MIVNKILVLLFGYFGMTIIDQKEKKSGLLFRFPQIEPVTDLFIKTVEFAL